MFQTLGELPAGWLLAALLLVAGFAAFVFGRRAPLKPLADFRNRKWHSRPNDYGYYAAIWTLIPMAAVLLTYLLFADTLIAHSLRARLPDYLATQGIEQDIFLQQVAEAAELRRLPPSGNPLFDAARTQYAVFSGQARAIGLCLAIIAGLLGYRAAVRRASPEFPARRHTERFLQRLLLICAGLAVLTTLGIIVSLLAETVHFFAHPDGPSVGEFLFGTRWSAQTGAAFGALPLFLGTLTIAVIAMAVAAPIGIFTAIYLAEYASPRLRASAKPALEVLAGIPTVVYGFMAALFVAPLVRSAAQAINGLSGVPDGFLAA
ncbi:MAG: phosphate ABC transporter permease family protein, partial [Pseudomonadota bacterium]